MSGDGPPSLADLINEAQGGSSLTKPVTTSKQTQGGGSPSLTDLINQAGGTPAAPKAAPASKPKSLLGQFKSIVQSVPSGLVGVGKDLGNDLNATFNPVEYTRGHVTTPKPGESASDYFDRTRPFTSSMVHSFGRTLGDVLHPSRLKKASDEGNIVGKVLEDAANASIALGPVARGAGAVGDRAAAAAVAEDAAAGAAGRATAARTTAKVVEGAARTTEKVAAAPLLPYKLATTGVDAGRVLSHIPGVELGDKIGALPLLGKAADKIASSDTQVGKLARIAKVDPESRMLRREVLNPAAEEQSAVVGRQVKLGNQVTKIVSDPVEQQAMTLVGEGQADALAKLRDVAPTRFDEFVRSTFGDTVTPEAAHLAADVAAGKAPEVAARIDEALKVGREGAGGRADRGEAYLAANPSRAWQTGFEPDQRAIDAATEKAMQGMPKAERLAKTLRQRADDARTTLEGARADASAAVNDRADAGRGRTPTYGMGKTLGRLETKAGQAETLAKRAEDVLGRRRERVRLTAEQTANSVEAAPARLRPALEVNRRATSVLADHANALRDQGLHDAAATVDKAATEIPTTLDALKAAGVDPDHFIHIRGGDKPTAAGVKSGASLPNVRKGREDKFRADSLHFDRSVRAQTQAEIDTAKTVVAKQTAEKVAQMPWSKRLGDLNLGDIRDQAKLKKAVADAGYSPWDPRSPFETPATIDRNTVLLPNHIKAGFKTYFNDPKYDQILRQTYDKGIQAVKVGQLALSPSWQVGNVAGNIMMATLGAGIDPVTLARNMVDAIRQYRASGPAGERDWEAVAPRRVFTAGPTHSEFRYLQAPEDQTLGRFPRLQKAASVAGAPARAAYAMNEAVDNIGRSAVFLAKKGQGLTDEQAVKSALQAMGDFSRMTPFERRTIRRVIPYYAWSRHITQLAFRLPIEHPLRVAWTLHLADEFHDPSTSDLPGSIAGAIRLPGGKLLEPGRFFPFGDAGRPLEPAGAISQLSPAIKIPVQSYTGFNLSNGKPFSRPPGSGRFDEFGSPIPTAPSVAHQVGGLFPQSRLLDAVTGHDQVARYNTGDKVVTATGTIKTGKTPGLGALRFLGVPLQNESDAVASAKRVADKEKANAKAKASYDKKLSKAKK